MHKRAAGTRCLLAGHRCRASGLLAVAWVCGFATFSSVKANDPKSSFVATFAQACVPKRLSHAATNAHVIATGWAEVSVGQYPKLKAVLAAADAELATSKEPGWVLRRKAFRKVIDGRAHFLVTTYVHAPEVITLAGCYLYDFNATTAIQPMAVSELLGRARARTTPFEGALVHIWGPSPKFQRTLDTYLYHVPAGSALAKRAGFTGVMLKFETSIETPE